MTEILINNRSILQAFLTWFGLVWLAIYLLRSPPVFRFRTHLPFQAFPNLILAVFVILTVYQARWQLFGFFSSDFLRVQRGFDPRGQIIGTRFQRGPILDRKHAPLAMDVKTDDGYLRRTYPLGSAAVHVLGYNHSKYGSSGIEKTLDSILMGRAVQTPADAFRLAANVFFHRTLRGNPVILTLDRDLQQAAWDILGNKTGSIVAIDPRDGSVRAMVSHPGFDPENLDARSWQSLLDRKDSPFLNRSVQGLYPPGSTFKILVAAAALEQQLSPVYICGPDGFDCGPADPRVKDHAHYSNAAFKGHGRLNLAEALSVSCNVYFAQLAVDLTAGKILDSARKAGLDTHVVFSGPSPGTVAGRLPERSKWHTARTARLGIGQDDVVVTPLHLAQLAGAIGNGGLKFRPRIIETQPSQLDVKLYDYRVANQIARMMIKTVETGTGQRARVTGIVVGGKTGTAESAGKKSHALFVCFAPWPRPALAVAVVVEHGGMGGSVAAPLAGEIIRRADALGLLEDKEIYRGISQ